MFTINKRYRNLHKCCNTDPNSNFAFSFVHFYKGYVYATEGHMCVRVPIKDVIDADMDRKVLEETLDGMSFRVSSWAAMVNSKRIQFEGGGKLRLEDKGMTIDGKTYNGSLTEQCQKLFANIDKKREDCEAVTNVNINAKMLFNLQTAMGAEYCELQFDGNKKKIFVYPDSGVSNEARGIIMPVIITI